MQEDLLIEFKKILLARSEIRDSLNCIYNRAAVSFVIANKSIIKRELAILVIQRSLDWLNDDSLHNGKIYTVITTCKVAVILLDRFTGDLRFVKTIVRKLRDLHTQIITMQQSKKTANSAKVIANLNIDCKSKIFRLFKDEELLELARSLPEEL